MGSNKSWTAFLFCPALGAAAYFKAVKREGMPVGFGMLGLMVGLGFLVALILWANDKTKK